MGRKWDDISGKRFGMLTAVEPTGERRNGYILWRCQCDCGREALVPSRHLKQGWTKDCGCAPKGIRRKRSDEEKEAVRHGRAARREKEWVGQRFGELTVAAYDGWREGKHYWRCLCGCGREAVVCQSNLMNGHTRSCGCKSSPADTRHFVEGTCIESIRSRKISVSNTSGIRGVYQDKRTGRWVAQITFQGRTRYLGSYDGIAEAAKARARGEELFDRFLEEYDRSAEGQVPYPDGSCPVGKGMGEA